MLHQSADEELPAEMQAMSTNPAKVRHHADPLHDYRSEHVELQEKLAEMWGAEEPYTPVVEETGSFFQRYYYSWVYKTVSLASEEKLTKEILPLPTKDVRAHESGGRLSRSIQKAMYARNAWNCMVGTAVVSTLDPASRGVLRWVGVPQQGGYTRMMAGVEWSVPPAVRTAARGDDSAVSPFFDGVVHGEHLFTPEHSDMSTLEEVTQVNLDFSCRGGVVAIPTPQRVPLFTLLVKALPYYFFVQIPFLLVSTICTVVLPTLLEAFVAFIKSPDPSWPYGLALVAGIFLVQATGSVCVQRYNYLSFRCGLHYRSALNAVIYEKCMIISSKSLAKPEMNAGRIINMVGTDTERVCFFMFFAMMVWGSPLVLLLAVLQLARLVGWCSILAIFCFVVTIPVNAYFMSIQMAARQNIMKATDARVKATNEFFSGIRIAKFMTWEPRFIAHIEAKRSIELFFLKRIQTSRIMMSFVNNATPIFMIAAVFTVYYLTGHDLSPTIVFPTIALLGVMRQPFQQIPWVFTMLIQFMISMGRINSFIECDNAACSTVQDIEDYFKEQHEHSTACQLAAVLENVDVTAYVPVKLPFAPKIKMSLLSRVLRMICCEQCKPTKRRPPPTAVAEELIYASPTSAVRRVVDGAPSPAGRTSPTAGKGAKRPQMKDEDFFELEPKVLLRDVSVAVPKGKLTLVLGATGSGKSTLLQSLLSQFELTQGRIWTEKSIAYVPQQPWIMNATVRGNILFFDEEEESRLGEAIRVSQLQTDLQLLGSGLETEIGEKGVNLSGGQKARVSLARAVYANREVYLLDDPLSALDAHVGERVVDDCFLGALAGKTRVLASHQMHVVPKADYVIALGHGSVEFSGSSADFMRSPIFASMAVGSAVHGEHEKEREEEVVEVLEAEDVIDEEPESAEKLTKSAAQKKDAEEDDDAGGHLIIDEEKASGGVPWSAYVAYFRFCGGVSVVAFIVLVFVFTELLTVSGSVWLSSWTTHQYNISDARYLQVYLVLVLATGAGYPLRFFFSYRAMLRGCVTMHRAILRSVTTGTMEFFDRTPLGRLLNRFSRDIEMLDNGLQMSTIALLECLMAIAAAMLVAAYSQPLVLLALVPCGYIYYRLMIFFNSANREVRRQSSILKTPVFTLLTELTNGLATIAAYGKSGVVMREALSRLDVVLCCGNLENNMNRWLAVRIEMLSNVVVTSVALVAVARTCMSSSSVNVALVSLSLTMAMQTTGQLNWLVRTIANVEADMNSVERILYYTEKIQKEEMPELSEEVNALEKRIGVDADATDTVVIESVSPTAAAPHVVRAGALTLDHVQMRYREGLPLVLRDVSFSIAPREKVGVVGRTGSGKSTLLLTFMRMVDICGGEIRVDGRALGSYGLRELRRHFSMIPQDPVLFDGTVRLNVDPFLEASSAEVWHALELVGLRERVASETEGIDGRVLEGGSNFSVGQRQLMCMARALLKKGSGFILMDEATANIDPALDRQIQTTVMSAFAEYTVITIAHRLHTVAQYDKIIVMDHGVVAEMGSPRELVMDRQSVFRGMVEAMGTSARAHFLSLL
ncbi:putative mitochondrial ATP-binding cassette protein subfamily C, member 1, putative (ABCC1) [Leptomonas pyrrhocoris]|uniref:Putative mitochondrial ATP-binding cassette protein subfamily C, member 1, putative (ABCC1) n=1 Tax=Leptomonas pyrrhocoris TaxID=157538 RepID=A0A0M9G7G9_LEPPY|nr:putative mitochondrial ATP-binding cassette protein subfamily C, member 1, putative (ABCC1) [Leptomonas pyrrhocoris]XP_015662567.1 putative mitochondrial ATP-binding cassette protein subfamily C, member 1, putative (ABCC1) [Leptomonas pyrrhocoris]KPA84127.1 putative mitochondrial ATP-binding cassette protein subfamily C, member 1, putative (ABCC1) [Leptomonas pyrrhocoris]KPA84128.1 putative mitochondrial ATP-binding cassette protein subfamily C, member 1, putative (ABCC1) [Leptomonas pyrrhoco|eukprot:XP_015662566.1 putative mitochondrial ATP-binding cassette protein subfamily C, member 1, putative (ABCC1) [Leptomonas pyrrhocoris]